MPGESFAVNAEHPNWRFEGRSGSDGYDRIHMTRKTSRTREYPLWMWVTAKRLGINPKIDP